MIDELLCKPNPNLNKDIYRDHPYGNRGCPVFKLGTNWKDFCLKLNIYKENY